MAITEVGCKAETASPLQFIFLFKDAFISSKVSSFRYPQIQTRSESVIAPDFQRSSLSSRTHPGWYAKMLMEINAASDLESGWDSYDAPVPSALAIEYSKNFLIALHGTTPKPVDVGPSVMGGMGFTFLSDDKEVFVEIYNNGDIYAMFMDESDTENGPRVDPFRTSNGFRYLLSEIREFLNA